MHLCLQRPYKRGGEGQGLPVERNNEPTLSYPNTSWGHTQTQTPTDSYRRKETKRERGGKAKTMKTVGVEGGRRVGRGPGACFPRPHHASHSATACLRITNETRSGPSAHTMGRQGRAGMVTRRPPHHHHHLQPIFRILPHPRFLLLHFDGWCLHRWLAGFLVLMGILVFRKLFHCNEHLF